MNVISTLFGEETIEHTKTCIKCGEVKSIFEFAARTSDRSDMLGVERRNECKDCMKKNQKIVSSLKKKYKKPAEYVICCGCGRHEDEFNKRWCLDHNHFNGEARGFICDDCNGLLGKARDNPQVLLNLYDYLIEGGNMHTLFPTLQDD